MSKRPVIGFLINDMVGIYQFELWSGIYAACRKFKIDLIIFTGGELGSDNPLKAVRSTVFTLANEKNVDGLILSASAIGNRFTSEQVIEYCRSFHPMPLVTLAIDVPGFPSVLIDNATGMENAVEHLITVHNRRNIAFIGGTPGNPDSETRQQAYRRVLKNHGIEIDPRHEEIANFDHAESREAMELLLLNDPTIDAVVAANDDMALGALYTLERQGIDVPGKIALCGFDDIDDSKFCTPPLFTVRQPLFEQGHKCVELLFDLIRHKNTPVSSVVIPAVLVPRKSCGCSGTLDDDNHGTPKLEQKLADVEVILQREAYEKVKMERQIWELQRLSAYLVNTFDSVKLIDYLSRQLPAQGINTAYLVLNDETENEPILKMAISDGVVFPLPREGVPVQPGSLFPDGYVKSGLEETLIVEPLFFESDHLGYFIYSMKPCRGMIMDALRTTISAALQGARLVRKVKIRTNELESANVQLQDIAQKVHDILDNIKQGLFTVNLDGTVNPEHSRSVETVLDITDFKNTTLKEIMRLNAEDEACFKKWLELVRDRHASMRWEKLVRLAPVQEIVLGFGENCRYIHFSYQKMYDRFKNLQKIMVLAIDVTESRRIEQIVATEKERHEDEVRIILGLVNNLPEIIKDYLRDTADRIETISAKLLSMQEPAKFARENYPRVPPYIPPQEDLLVISQDLHTIKGNSATFGFDKISKIAHETEDLLLALKRPIEIRVTVTIAELLDKISALKAAYNEILSVQARLNSSNGDTYIPLPQKRVERIREIAKNVELKLDIADEPFKQTIKQLIHACEHLRDVPLVKLTEKYKNLISRLAIRLNKKVNFEVFPADLEVSPHLLSPIDEALVHIFRNSLDHGIESPEERRVRNKSETGLIRLEIFSEEKGMLVRITDDGCGINVSEVLKKAVQDKIITAEKAESLSPQEKVMLLFDAGVSTAREVSDISGRGIGMAAVKRNIESINGSISVETHSGIGTTIEIWFPLQSIPL